MASFWCRHCQPQTHSTSCSSVSFKNLEHAIAGWVFTVRTNIVELSKYSKAIKIQYIYDDESALWIGGTQVNCWHGFGYFFKNICHNKVSFERRNIQSQYKDTKEFWWWFLIFQLEIAKIEPATYHKLKNYGSNNTKALVFDYNLW